MGTKWISHSTGWVIFTCNMWQVIHTHRHSFPCMSILNCIMNILEIHKEDVEVGWHSLIFSLNMLCAINRKPKYFDLVSHLNDQISGNYSGHQFWSAVHSFHIIMMLHVPLDWIFVDNHQYSSNFTPIFEIRGKIWINNGGNLNSIYLFLRQVMCKILHIIGVYLLEIDL